MSDEDLVLYAKEMAGGRFLGVSWFALLALGLPPAAGASGGTDAAMAEALFQEGRKLVEQKRYGDACPKFAESQRLDPGIGTLLNLAACHELEGKTATAWTEFTQAVGLAEREARSDAGQFARGHLAALTPKLPKIAINVPKESETPGLEVSLDGQALGKPAWGLSAPIDPGTHVIAAAAAGRKRWVTQVAFGAGEQKSIVVPPLEVEASAEPPTAPAAATRPTAEGSETSPPPPRETTSPVAAPASPVAPAMAHGPNAQRTAGLVVGGAGLVAMGAGVALGLSAKGTYDDSAKYCDASGCEPQGLDLRSKAVGKGQVATLVFALGAGTAVGGAVLWLAAPRERGTASSARLGVSPRGVVIAGTW